VDGAQERGADTSGVHLRRARAEDFPAIRRLIRVGRINPIGLSWQRFLVVASGDEQVLACGQIKPHGDGTRELASIAVDPAQRGRGYARRVIERLLAENDPPLYLTCRQSMGPLYEKFGFRALSPAEMTPYYRRLSRLANALHRLKILPERMLVMRSTP
jgi:N-acetylglutamate synthase-like GNAT family acetyltransferase